MEQESDRARTLYSRMLGTAQVMIAREAPMQSRIELLGLAEKVYEVIWSEVSSTDEARAARDGDIISVAEQELDALLAAHGIAPVSSLTLAEISQVIRASEIIQQRIAELAAQHEAIDEQIGALGIFDPDSSPTLHGSEQLAAMNELLSKREAIAALEQRVRFLGPEGSDSEV